MLENPAQSTVSAQPVPTDRRSFRVKLRGSVLVLLRLPNRRQVRSAFHMLSASGGMVHLEKPLDEKIEVEMIFHLGNETIHAKAVMLFPMWATQGWLQPFHFTDLSDATKESIATNLQSFIGEMANGASAGS
jgi:hypothetical protein